MTPANKMPIKPMPGKMPVEPDANDQKRKPSHFAKLQKSKKSAAKMAAGKPGC